jgi:cation-transporting ATPase E
LLKLEKWPAWIIGCSNPGCCIIGCMFEGLSSSEVNERVSKGLVNKALNHTSRSYWQILRENVFTFINNALFLLGFVLILLGRTSDALVSVGVILINTLVSVVQEIRAKHTLDKIALLTRPTAMVKRDGQLVQLDPSQVVQDDVLYVQPGDQVLVDGPFLGDGQIEMDESLLTGESDPVRKKVGDLLYSGSFVVSGSGYYQAQKVGGESTANQLLASARAYRKVLTPLQQQIGLVIRVLLLVALYLEFLLAMNMLINKIPFVESVKMSVIIIGMVPNGLFLAISLSYALGAVRIAGKGALLQQSNAVESLSNVDVLCLDKTGTLTANRILLNTLFPLGITEEELRQKLGDFTASGSSRNATAQAILNNCPGQPQTASSEAPFSSARKWSGLVLAGGTYILGAPEIVRPALSLDPVASTLLDAQLKDWVAKGLRVVLFAYHPDPVSFEGDEHNLRLPENLIPLGLISFSDELRPEARQTLEEFAKSGVQVKVISGDNPHTVAALAVQAGLSKELKAVSGLDLAQMSPAEFSQAAEEASVFGRITPQQKEQLVLALRERGHYVAMIGDGVNDVLSLKRAQLGIAMQSGSQAARSVADIILMKDSFGVLPQAVSEGQRILNGMQDILKLYLARILAVALLVLSCGIIGGFPFSPKQSSLVAFFSVGLPSLALAVWARPSGRTRLNLIRFLVRFSLPAGLSVSVAGLVVYVAFLVIGFGPLGPGLRNGLITSTVLAEAQTALTIFSMSCSLFLIVFVEPPVKFFVGADRLAGDWRPTFLAGGLLATLFIIVGSPRLSAFFDLAPLQAYEYAILTLAVLLWLFALRWVWRHRWLERFLSADLG